MSAVVAGPAARNLSWNPGKSLMKNAISIVLLGAALSACGGGSDGGTPEVPAKPPVVVTPPVVPADSVTVASQAVAKEAGLSVIAGASADESVYDVAADIGDTWRITFDSVKKTYAIRVLSTQFGLSDRSGTFSATTTGNLTTYTATDFSVTVDARTRLLSGNIKLGNMVSTVSGSGYAVGDVAKLAGNYIFLGAMRNASNGADRFNPKGSLKIAADGAAQLCNGGVFNAQGVCSAVSPQLEAENASLTPGQGCEERLACRPPGWPGLRHRACARGGPGAGAVHRPLQPQPGKRHARGHHRGGQTAKDRHRNRRQLRLCGVGHQREHRRWR